MPTAMIVDDHPFIRASVRLTLEHHFFDVIGEADNGIEALHMARDLEPDLLVLDIALPGLDGLQVANRVRSLGLRIRILILTTQTPDYYSLRSMKMGAMGYICKSDDLPALGRAALALMSGFTFFPDVVLSSVHCSEHVYSEQECIASLSDRELAILRGLAKGMTNMEISRAILVSNKTVSTYKTRLIEKLRVRSVVDLADVARRHSLI
ncbi:response regulator transcription factor [Pseudomonas sp. dw_358]|uniref:response regulator transcription factor n=1 Tax=Pseudomonas sp. dw_358 TaxID=2720083 RepID=UPI001BD1D633|nr:response regulator transcription factor [Pseudomonas sp. dw_358]